MLVIIFSYNRPKMLQVMLDELKEHEVFVIDDGSDAKDVITFHTNQELIKTPHEGKKGFWKKWQIAHSLCTDSKHDYFLFLPDDLKDLDLETIDKLTKQKWEDKSFCLNLSNGGTLYRWGEYTTGQSDFTIGDYTFKECGYVDGLFITNRKTIELFDIKPVPESWHNREGKSSGVGYQLTHDLRTKGVTMMKPDYGFCFHGDHDSVMHYEHRKTTPLFSTMKPSKE